MLLTIDIGNTNVTLGAYNSNILSFTARLSTDSGKTSDQYAIEIKDVLSLYGQSFEDIEAVSYTHLDVYKRQGFKKRAAARGARLV